MGSVGSASPAGLPQKGPAPPVSWALSWAATSKRLLRFAASSCSRRVHSSHVARQVRALARWLAREDAAGRLAACFGRPAGLEDGEAEDVLEEEGWILGVD